MDEKELSRQLGRSFMIANPPFVLPALPADLSIYTARETHASWLAFIGERPESDRLDPTLASIDASRVETIDGAGVQLLTSLARTLALRGLTLVIEAPSHILRRSCETAGIASLLRADAESHA